MKWLWAFVVLAGILVWADDGVPYRYVYNIEDAFTVYNLTHHEHAQRALNQYIMAHCRIETWGHADNPVIYCSEFGYDDSEVKK